jgi:hypothetical protein
MSDVTTTAFDAEHVERWKGGGRWVVPGGLAGLVLIVLTLGVGAATGGLTTALYSYLVAFAYWCGIAMASLVLLMIMHAFKARWVTVIRRPIEVMSASILIFVLLAIPLVAWLGHIYEWVHPPDSLGRETLKLIAHKRPYLNPGFFYIRLAIYFVLWGFVAERLYGWSKRQDTAGTLDSLDLTQRQRSLGAGALPFVALTFSFAAFDWLMSINPTWYSTVFGVYYFGGSFVSALSLLAILTYRGRAKTVFGGAMSVEHTHNVGKLMLAFVCFWTYIAFSQAMLIWVAGLPEEIPFYIVRFSRGWWPMGALLIIGHFFLPFGALLSRPLKRDPRRLRLVAYWILFIHYVDIYWLVMPKLDQDGFRPHWTDVTAFFGVGLVAVAFGVSRMRGQFPMPIKDPYLAESVRYRQP